MTKLKLSAIEDDSPVKMSITLSAELHRDLVDYAAILATNSGKLIDPSKLIAPMLEQFIASDRVFRKMRARQNHRRSNDPHS
jgi:hypothetical protein